MNTNKRKLKVFLSYASQDRSAVRELYERLKDEGWIDPWLDVEDLSLGQHWTTVIEDALDNADVVLVFLSNNSVQKEGFIQRELNYAWELSLEKPRGVIFLIPLRLDECQVPRYLRSRQWGDYFGKQKEITYSTLLHSLQERNQQVLRLEKGEKAEHEVAEKADKKTAKEKVERKAEEKAQNLASTGKEVSNELKAKRNADEKLGETSYSRLRVTLKNRSSLFWIGGSISVLVVLFLAMWLGNFLNKENLAETTPTESLLPSNEALEPTLLPLSTEYAKGISVSFLNNVNWSHQKEDGIDFTLIRATQDITLVDLKFNDHWSGAASVGIPRCAYFSFEPYQDPSEQVEFFIRAFEEAIYDGELPPAVKLSNVSNQSNDEYLSNLLTVLTKLESKTGWKPIIYTEYDFANDNLRDHSGNFPNWLAQYPLWIEQTPEDITNIETKQPNLPDDWPGDWLFWTYFNGSVGLEHLVDLNLFNGSPKDLQNFIKDLQNLMLTEKFGLKTGEHAWGIDVSLHQGEIDWTRVKIEQPNFVFVQATEGDSYINPAFDDHWLGIKTVGIPRGAYHIFDFDKNWQQQAVIFLQVVKSLKDYGDLPPVLYLDSNLVDGQLSRADISAVKSWLDRVEYDFGRKPIIYSSLSFLNEGFINPETGSPDWAKYYMLWITEDNSDVTEPILPHGWEQWTFWQYMDDYTIDGIETTVALDIFNGTSEDLQLLFYLP